MIVKRSALVVLVTFTSIVSGLGCGSSSQAPAPGALPGVSDHLHSASQNTIRSLGLGGSHRAPFYVRKDAVFVTGADALDAISKKMTLPRYKRTLFSAGAQYLKRKLADPSYSTDNTFFYQDESRRPDLTAAPVIQRTTVSFDTDWMRYGRVGFGSTPGQNMTYFNFSNRYLGGGWSRGGDVQEESMVARCPELAALLSMGEVGFGERNLELVTRAGDNLPKLNGSNPLLMGNLLCPYAQAKNQSLSTVKGAPASEIPMPAPFNMLALAAPEYGGVRTKTYDLLRFQDLFENAFHAIAMVKAFDLSEGKTTQIVSGLWGAGAFGHDPQVSYAAQYLAAHLAGLDGGDVFVLTGASAAFNSGFRSLGGIQSDVDAVLAAVLAAPPTTLGAVVAQVFARGQANRWITLSP